MNNNKIVQGLPASMGTWIWEYTPGHGYTGRHAYSQSNPELSLPYRQVMQIRKQVAINPAYDYKPTIAAALERRDIIVEIHPDNTWNHRVWRSVDFQFSTGALGFIEHLDNTTRIFITVTGIPKERDSSGDIYDRSRGPVTRTMSGYATASYYKKTSTFYQTVTYPAYASYDPIYVFTVHYEVV